MEDYLPTGQAAKYVQCPIASFKKFANRGLVDRIKVGNNWYYKPEDLDAIRDIVNLDFRKKENKDIWNGTRTTN